MSSKVDSPAVGDLPMPDWIKDPTLTPMVNVVVPVYNEAECIVACLEAVLGQGYPRERLEIHVVDGASDDGSAELVQEHFVLAGEPVWLHTNPDRKTAKSLNIGIRESSGDIVIILGAHTEICADFIARNIENLRRPKVMCSGGTQINVGSTRRQVAIGAAMSHPFGMPTAPYRFRKTPGFVPTVVYGAYRREIFQKIGFFEEEGRIAEDADVNWRIIQAGFKIYFDPLIKTKYFPRSTFRSLVLQMFRYGIFRAYLFRKHFGGTSWLHVVPPVFVLCLTGLAIGAFIIPILGSILLMLAGAYTLAALIIGIITVIGKTGANPILVAASYITIHLSWGAGFLFGLTQRKIHFSEFIN